MPRTCPLIVLALCFAAGCAHNNSSAFVPAREPRIIVIRNATNRPLESLALQEDHDDKDSPRRVGAISPVVPNHTYTIRRLPDAPPLPSRLRVNYRYPNQPPQTALVDLRPLAKQAKGDAGEALVFELRTDGAIDVHLDHLQP
jgi:hypothetical protein